MHNTRFSLLFGSLVLVALCGCQTIGLKLINAASPSVRRIPDLTFAPGPRGRFDLYVAAGAAAVGARPLVVFWYGGSWQSGRKSDYAFVGAALASRGTVVAVPDYRLYPEVRFPEFLRDAAEAVARAQQEAVKLGADPKHTVLGGHSAGAYIAAMLALEPRYLRDAGVDPGTIRGFFALSGPHALDPDTAVLKEIFNSRATPEQFQPLARVHPGAPPALLVHGGSDDLVRPDHSERLAAALRANGVPVELRIESHRGHVDTVLGLSRPGAFRMPGLIDEVMRFITHPPASAPMAYLPAGFLNFSVIRSDSPIST
ncbi:MAG TPA: alpha/beta hydrolase [Steroidobacteraceae bacterium]|nr:alpha/beta hydrolase [Steroidobacteraceae bacterium]